MQTNRNRRKFYIITVAVLIGVIGTAVLITEYVQYSYVKIEVLSNSNTSFTISYNSTSVTLATSENATVEVLPHANVTVTATVTAPYEIAAWEVEGVATTQHGQDSVSFLTGAAGQTIMVSVELTKSSG